MARNYKRDRQGRFAKVAGSGAKKAVSPKRTLSPQQRHKRALATINAASMAGGQVGARIGRSAAKNELEAAIFTPIGGVIGGQVGSAAGRAIANKKGYTFSQKEYQALSAQDRKQIESRERKVQIATLAVTAARLAGSTNAGQNARYAAHERFARVTEGVKAKAYTRASNNMQAATRGIPVRGSGPILLTQNRKGVYVRARKQ